MDLVQNVKQGKGLFPNANPAASLIHSIPPLQTNSNFRQPPPPYPMSDPSYPPSYPPNYGYHQGFYPQPNGYNDHNNRIMPQHAQYYQNYPAAPVPYPHYGVDTVMEEHVPQKNSTKSRSKPPPDEAKSKKAPAPKKKPTSRSESSKSQSKQSISLAASYRALCEKGEPLSVDLKLRDHGDVNGLSKKLICTSNDALTTGRFDSSLWQCTPITRKEQPMSLRSLLDMVLEFNCGDSAPLGPPDQEDEFDYVFVTINKKPVSLRKISEALQEEQLIKPNVAASRNKPHNINDLVIGRLIDKESFDQLVSLIGKCKAVSSEPKHEKSVTPPSTSTSVHISPKNQAFGDSKKDKTRKSDVAPTVPQGADSSKTIHFGTLINLRAADSH